MKLTKAELEFLEQLNYIDPFDNSEEGKLLNTPARNTKKGKKGKNVKRV